MTENKRFGYGADVNWQGDIIIDYETEKSYDFYEVGKLLNELAEENEQSKIMIATLRNIILENEDLEKENKELKEINQDNQDYISSLEEEKINLQIKLQKIRDYAMEDGEVKQGVIEKVIWND